MMKFFTFRNVRHVCDETIHEIWIEKFKKRVINFVKTVFLKHRKIEKKTSANLINYNFITDFVHKITFNYNSNKSEI